MWAVNGAKTVWREEYNFRIEVAATLAVLLAAWWLNFNMGEVVVLVFCILLVLSSEIVNTAIEDVCNKINPEHDPIIGKIKDTMAAFVLLNVGGAAVIGTIVFARHFGFI